MAGIDHSKYIVLDRNGETIKAEDVFVLRKGDLLASLALESYAANVYTVLDVDGLVGSNVPSKEKDHLAALADDVMVMAQLWRVAVDKLPD